MSDTVTSAQLADVACSSCRGRVAVIEFTIPVAGPKRTVYACAMCLVGIIDQALGTQYAASLQVGLINRALGQEASARRRARGKRVRSAPQR